MTYNIYKDTTLTYGNYFKISSSIIILALMLESNTSFAQEALNETSSSSNFSIDIITVTARKREENLQDTPLSITAHTAQSLSDRQIDSSTELARITPNLTFDTHAPASGHNSASQVFIRGIGQTDFQALTDPGVGVYIDGVYHARTLGSVIDFMDLERIEILRGPQGTLFGRNTIGGAISLISKKPSDEFEGSGKVTVGADRRIDTTISANLPLTDSMAVRFSGGTRNRDGYVTRLVDGQKVGDDNTKHLKTNFLWKPKENLEISVIGDYTKEDENGAPTVFAAIGTGASNSFGRIASAQAGCTLLLPNNAGVGEGNDLNCANNQWYAGPYSSNGTFPIKSQLETWGLAGTITYQTDQLTFKSITSYRSLTAQSARDADNTPLRVLHTTFDTDDAQFSQEFQLGGTALNNKLNWVSGLYYFNQSAEDIMDVFLPVGDFRLAGPVDVKSHAAFFQATYDITQKLALTAGLRYTEETKFYTPDSYTLSSYSYPGNANGSFNPGGSDAALLPSNAIVSGALVTLLPNTPFVPKVRQQNSAKKLTPLINLAYKINQDFMIYANYSQGFKGGGFSTRIVNLEPRSPDFKPEFANSYEIGFKSIWGNGLLRLNGSAFYTDYKGTQIVVRPQLAPLVFNAGKANIKGFELEWTVIASDNLLLTGSIGHIDAKYQQLDNIVTNAGISLDHQLQQTPKWVFNMGAAYAIYMNNNITLTPRIDYSFRSKNYVDAENTEILSQPSFSLVNASMALDIDDKNLRFVFAVKNITDERYRVAGFSSINGSGSYAETVYARPREWSLSAQYKF